MKKWHVSMACNDNQDKNMFLSHLNISSLLYHIDNMIL